MSRSYREELPDDFPDHLLQAAQDLRQLYVDELAWLYLVVLDVIDVLAAHGLVISGGDVIRITPSGPDFTGDSWYINENTGLPQAEYVREAVQRAKTYIEAYHARNGDGFCYSVIFH
ncbi:MAG: Imm40 family immunity protein [Ktedonobacterales bacterium]